MFYYIYYQSKTDNSIKLEDTIFTVSTTVDASKIDPIALGISKSMVGYLKIKQIDYRPITDVLLYNKYTPVYNGSWYNAAGVYQTPRIVGFIKHDKRPYMIFKVKLDTLIYKNIITCGNMYAFVDDYEHAMNLDVEPGYFYFLW